MSGPCNRYCNIISFYSISLQLLFSPRQYLWMDEKGKRIKLTAPQYVDYVMTYAQKAINDESIFPTKFGNFLTFVFPHKILLIIDFFPLFR